MNHATDKRVERESHGFQWIWEVLIFAIVTPALVHGVLSLQNLPIV